MRRNASPACIDLIRASEGFSPVVYVCPSGHPSIGYGHKITAIDHIDAPITPERGLSLMLDDLAAIEIYLTAVLPAIPQCQFDALASFAYNLGLGVLEGSTLLKLVRAGDVAGATAEFGKWIHAHVNGVKVELPGLIKRRAAEAALFASTPKGAQQ